MTLISGLLQAALVSTAPHLAVSEDLIWVVTSSPDLPGHFDVAVGNSEAPDEGLTVVRRLGVAPEALAAEGHSLWVQVPRANRPDLSDVLQVSATYNDSMGTWLAAPANGWGIVPSLVCPSSSQLVATQEGLWMLCGASPPELFRLEEGRWAAIEFDPQEGGHWQLLGGDARPTLVGVDGQEQWIMLKPEGTDAWAPKPVHKREPGELILSGGHVVLARDDGGALSLNLIRSGRMQPVTSLAIDGAWALSGASSGLWLLDQGASGGGLRLRLVQLPEGKTSLSTPITIEAATPIGVWSMLLSIGIAAVVISVLLTTRGVTGQLPAGLIQLGLLRRAIAAAIDLLPATAAVVLVFEVNPSGLIRMPLAGFMPSSLEPIVYWATGSGFWVLIWTTLLETTPGLMLAGGRVVTQRGGPIGTWAATGRGIMLSVVLLAPVLAALVVLSPQRRSLADLFSGTLVVRRGNWPPAGEPVDGTDG
ncbi:MAG: RDD family protein [Phycisphaerales bacterium]|nr:RDD family protein [Phycisphaerales bacterium]